MWGSGVLSGKVWDTLLPTFPLDPIAYNSLSALCSSTPSCPCLLCLKHLFPQVHSLPPPRPHSNDAKSSPARINPLPLCILIALCSYLSYLSHSSVHASSNIRPRVMDLGRIIYLGRDPRKHCDRVGSETKKGEKLIKGILMSRLLLWASGLSSIGDPLRVWVACTQKCSTEGQGTATFIWCELFWRCYFSDHSSLPLRCWATPRLKNAFMWSDAGSHNSWWNYPEWEEGEPEGIWTWQRQAATTIDSCVSSWKAGNELHSSSYTPNTQYAALYLVGA